MGQVQGGGDDFADPARADGGVTQRFAAADEDREAAFTLPAQSAQQPVVAAVAGGEPTPVGGCLTGVLMP